MSTVIDHDGHVTVKGLVDSTATSLVDLAQQSGRDEHILRHVIPVDKSNRVPVAAFQSSI